jgi:ferredoxin-type protein NapF
MEAGAVNLQRRRFLRGELTGSKAPLRPPWGIAEAQFTACCSRCEACLAACPDRLIVRGSGGFPEIDFARGGCSFCGACLRACSTGALLSPRPTVRNAWGHQVSILDGCLARRGVVCRSCGDVCEPGAIAFRPQPGGRCLPELSPEACTGCGSCVAVCPFGAVQVQAAAEQSA